MPFDNLRRAHDAERWMVHQPHQRGSRPEMGAALVGI